MAIDDYGVLHKFTIHARGHDALKEHYHIIIPCTVNFNDRIALS